MAMKLNNGSQVGDKVGTVRWMVTRYQILTDGDDSFTVHIQRSSDIARYLLQGIRFVFFFKYIESYGIFIIMLNRLFT